MMVSATNIRSDRLSRSIFLYATVSEAARELLGGRVGYGRVRGEGEGREGRESGRNKEEEAGMAREKGRREAVGDGGGREGVEGS